MKKIDPDWKPGFETEAKAIKAGKKFFEKANGMPGRHGRDFHISTNAHGRFHFEDGPVPSAALPPSEDPTHE